VHGAKTVDGKVRMLTTHIEVQICDICGNPIDIKYTEDGTPYWAGGHNAEPIVDGRCCDKCQYNVVLPERIRRAMS